MGIGAVVALHGLLGYALVSGLARKAIEVVKKPLETRIVEEVKLPPPKQSAGPLPPPAPPAVLCPYAAAKARAPPDWRA